MKSEVNSALMSASRNAVRRCLGVGKGEDVIILTDEERLPIAKALTRAIIEQNAYPNIFLITERQRDYFQDSVPRVLCHALKRTDVVIALYAKTIKKKTFVLKMTKKLMETYPCRIALLPGITTEAFSESMQANFSAMEKLAEQLILTFLGSHDFLISTESGTRLSFSMSSEKFAPETSSGILKELYSVGNLPGAEIYGIPLPSSAQGKLVVDGSIPNHLVDNPFYLEIKDGKVDKIEPRSNRFAKYIAESLGVFGEGARVVGEFGIGLNGSISRFYGITLVDEKILHTCHFGLGDNSFFGGHNRCGVHIDLVIRNPTITVNGDKTIMENGSFTFDVSDFQRSYEEIPFAEIDPNLIVVKQTNKMCSTRGNTFQVFWKGGGGQIHFSSIFDSETSAFAVKIWKNLNVVGKNILQLQRECKLDQVTLAKVLKLLEKYGFVTFHSP